MNANLERSIALVLAAHGDRGGDAPNQGLAAHVAALKDRHWFASVTGGVLNGDPPLYDALMQADASGARQVIIYPLFMSAGHFVKNVLTDKVSAAGLNTPTGILQPLGLDKRLALLMLESAVVTARSAGVDPSRARLLVVGHGSRNGPENAEATRRAARLLAPHSPFARIETAFLEEVPFVADALGHYGGTSVVAGFLTGEGLHASEDVPAAIEASGVRALYTGPIGLHPRVPELIVSAVHHAFETSAPEDSGEAAAASAAGEDAEEEYDEDYADEEYEAEAYAEAYQEEARQAQPEVAARAAAEPGEPRSRRRRGFSPLRLLLRTAFVLIMMAVLAAAAVAFLVPRDVVRDRVAQLVKQHTGRDLTIRGDTSFTVFPNFGVEMEKVSVSNPPGMTGGNVLQMDSLNLNLKLMPLFTRNIEVDRFVLVRPQFNLVVDAQGRRNWDLRKQAARAGNGPDEVALHGTPPAMMQAQGTGFAGGMVRGISLGSVEVVDGTVSYVDEREGASHRIEAVNVSLKQQRLTAPLSADGSFVWQGEKISFDGHLEAPAALMLNGSSNTRVSVSTRHGEGSFEGQAGVNPALSANGAVSARTPSLRALVNWLGDPLPPGGGLGPASINGHLGLEGQTVTFTDAKLDLDGMRGEGQVSLQLKGVRPHITASLALDKLDLNPYLEGTSVTQRQSAPSPRSETPPAPDAAAPKPEGDQSLTDFIEKLNKSDDGSAGPQPEVRAWSQRAIDLTGLRAADAEVRIKTGAIHYRDIRTSDSALTATLKSGVLNADITRLSLYSGEGTGKVTVNGARAVPVITALFNLNGISALPLLRDSVDFDWISGRANMALSLSGAGQSQSEMMRSLKGQGRLVFSNGAIEGINIPAMVRGLQQGRFDGWQRDERQKTDFSQFSGSFQVQNGVATNNDLKLVGPLIRMSGEGTVDIGRERLDYAALPRIVATLQGQGAELDDEKKELAVPVRVTGPWAKPKIRPDVERLLNDPELAEETVNKVGKIIDKLKDKDDVNRVLQGILGGGNQQGAGQDGGGTQQGQDENGKIDAEELLKNLFRKGG